MAFSKKTISANKSAKNSVVNENQKKEKSNSYTAFYIIAGLAVFFIILLEFYDKKDNDFSDTQISVDTTAITPEIPKETTKINETILRNFTYEDVARYAIATSMQEPVNIIKSKKKDGYYYVAYVRPSDSQKFEYKVKFEGNNIIWGDLYGRWQDTGYDEKITFEEIGDKITIILDGNPQVFSKGD